MTILSDFIHIYDDFLTQEDHIDVFKTLCQPVWGYGHKSDTRNPFSFWNIEFCGIKDSYIDIIDNTHLHKHHKSFNKSKIHLKIIILL